MELRTVRRIALTVYTVSLVFIFLFYTYLVKSRPNHPDVAKGYRFSLAAHGPPVFVTIYDLLALCGPIALSVGLLWWSDMARRRRHQRAPPRRHIYDARNGE
jgi:hypothetical protein